jgi:hypothetical protein
MSQLRFRLQPSSAIVTDELKIFGHAQNLQPPQVAVLRHQKSQMFLVEVLLKDSYSADNS